MANTYRAPSRIPFFDTIEEEAEFWDTHDSTEFEDEFEPVDWEIGEVRSYFVINVKFDRETWDRLRSYARSQDVPLNEIARSWVLDGYAKAIAGSNVDAPAGE